MTSPDISVFRRSNFLILQVLGLLNNDAVLVVSFPLQERAFIMLSASCSCRKIGKMNFNLDGHDKPKSSTLSTSSQHKSSMFVQIKLRQVSSRDVGETVLIISNRFHK